MILGPDMFDSLCYWKLSTYLGIVFVGLVLICTMIYVSLIILLVGSVVIPIVFYNPYSSISGCNFIFPVIQGASILPGTDTVLYIPLLSRFTIYGIIEMTLNAPTVFDKSFARSSFVIHAD